LPIYFWSQDGARHTTINTPDNNENEFTMVDRCKYFQLTVMNGTTEKSRQPMDYEMTMIACEAHVIYSKNIHPISLNGRIITLVEMSGGNQLKDYNILCPLYGKTYSDKWQHNVKIPLKVISNINNIVSSVLKFPPKYHENIHLHQGLYKIQN
jgi:hypothetical protein